MMKIQRMVVLVASIVCSSGVYAYDQDDEIIEIGSWSDGHALVRFKNANNHNCPGAGSDGTWFSIGTAAQSEKRRNMLTIATTALATGRQVYIKTAGCSESDNEEIVIFMSVK